MKTKLNFDHHFYEEAPKYLQNFKRSKFNVETHKIQVWNEFANSGLSDILEQDCSIYPRILPGSYLPVIKKSAFEITEMVMKLMTLKESEIKSIFPNGPIRDFLVNELEVIKYRPKRLVGSMRFDMAIVGRPSSNNPPKLLEINEIGFDGLARMPFIHQTLFKLMPELQKKYFVLDTSKAEINNMRRLAKSGLARIQTDCYNWDEECLLRRARVDNYDLRLVTPKQYGFKNFEKDYPYLNHWNINIDSKGKLEMGGGWRPEAFMMSFALTLEDYKKSIDLYRTLIRRMTPHYGPFVTGLFASKSILMILGDKSLRRKLLGSEKKLENTILGASMLYDMAPMALDNPEKFVIKHVDGFGGEQVFMDNELVKTIKKTPKNKFNEWVLQERIDLNTLMIDGILSNSRKAICDLGVFVQYDWENSRFNHFEVGGFLSRATDKSLKVNISSGGAQVGVMFDKVK